MSDKENINDDSEDSSHSCHSSQNSSDSVQDKKLLNVLQDIPKAVPLDVYSEKICKYQHILSGIRDICLESGEAVAGNLFTEHLQIDQQLSCLKFKQANLFTLAENATNIMEIGFNAGHSTLIYLIANDYSKIVLFDICEHLYTIPCFQFLSAHFPDRLTLYKGKSEIGVNAYMTSFPNEKFDLAHVDGGHAYHTANVDCLNTWKLVKKNGFMVVDDTQMAWVDNLFTLYVSIGLIKEIFLHKTKHYHHRIAQVIH